MKKYWKLATIVTVLVAVVALVSATATFAQGPTNNGPVDRQISGGNGPGMNNQAGTNMGMMAVDEADMHAAIAEALGMSLDEFETAVAEGKTPATLADELGIDFAEVQAAMDALHEAAFDQAVADGLITQEQADWVTSHRGGAAGQSGRMGNGQTGSHGAGSAGRSHNNAGGGTGECVYQTP